MDADEIARERRAGERARLHARLDELLDEREALESALEASDLVVLGGKARAGYAATVDFAADVAGEVITWTSLQPYFPGEGARKNTLVMLVERLRLAARLLGSPGGQRTARGLGGRGIPVSCLSLDVTEISEQLLAVSRGDETALFRREVRKQGERTNQSRLARCQLRALQYDRYLESKGLKAAGRRAEIVDAFGVSDWDTVRKWRKPCERILGRELVEYLLGLAAAGHVEGHGEGPGGLGVRAAGEEYLRVMNSSRTT